MHVEPDQAAKPLPISMHLRLDRMEQNISKMQQDLKEVRQALLGNGNPEAGLTYRFLNVEHTVTGVKRVMWIVLTPVILSVIALVSKVLVDAIARGVI